MHQESGRKHDGNDSSASGLASRIQMQGQGFIDGEETLNILDELRDEILKESKEQIADELEQLLQEYEERNFETKQREIMDYILENMPGLPDLV